MEPPGVDLYWLPLGPGGWFVRLNGKAYEALVAARDRRPRAVLYHSALIVTLPEARFAIESGPVTDGDSAARGVVCEGAVGHRTLGRFRVFRHVFAVYTCGVHAGSSTMTCENEWLPISCRTGHARMASTMSRPYQ